jgi:hypothetical protein
VLAAAALVTAGCGGASPSSAPAAASSTPKTSAKEAKTAANAAPKAKAASLACITAPTSVSKKILHTVILQGAKLDHVRAVASPDLPGYYFVSSHVSGGGAGPHALATWAERGLDGHGIVYAVDSFAALISLDGNASQVDLALDIHTPGAYKSRVCSYGPGAPHGTPAPPTSGPGNPATG